MRGLGNCVMATAALIALAACGVQVSTTPEPEPAQNEARAGGPSTAATLGIPPGHLPPPGKCKVWMPGSPPGHQADARDCHGIEADAPAGSWVLYRPSKDKKIVHVREMDSRRSGVVIHVRVYEASSGKYLREVSPG
ncbi:MAG: hypothetical protein JSW71_12975 [Gemmatimonadota bacterium]|nr:MAG: hypothetical protein JSW71_12975 [Gemmatimonadota bacterium]